MIIVDNDWTVCSDNRFRRRPSLCQHDNAHIQVHRGRIFFTLGKDFCLVWKKWAGLQRALASTFVHLWDGMLTLRRPYHPMSLPDLSNLCMYPPCSVERSSKAEGVQDRILKPVVFRIPCSSAVCSNHSLFRSSNTFGHVNSAYMCKC